MWRWTKDPTKRQKIKGSFQSFHFSKVGNFLSLWKYRSSSINLKTPLVMPKLHSKRNQCILANTHFGKNEILIYENEVENSHVCGQVYQFQSEIFPSVGYLSTTDAPMLDFSIPKQIEVMIILEYKNYANTPAVLEVWVSSPFPCSRYWWMNQCLRRTR